MLQILRSFTREEIFSGIYKIPLDVISSAAQGGDIVIGGPSGGTQASAMEALYLNVVMPWSLRYDEEFDRDVTWRFGGGVWVQHDFSSNPVLERRRLERANAVVQLVDRGVLLNDAIRWLRLELEERPHGNDWWIKNDCLPARLVLDAGKTALKIAIPDPVEPQRKKAQEQYIGEVLTLATAQQIIEAVRSDPAVRAANTGKTNRERIAEILAGACAGRAGAGNTHPAPAGASEAA